MNDPLYGNKLASAILAALLLLFGLPIIADSFFGSHGGGHGADHGEAQANAFPQYPIEIELGGGPAVAVAKMDIGTMMASADMARGERAAALCGSCHTFNEGGAHGTGPNLWNIVGRPVATVPGFSNYSGALKAHSGTWTYEALSEFLKNSQEYIPGSAMVQLIRKDTKRADILAYLGSLSTNPVPFPAPLAAAAAEAEAEGEVEARSDEPAGR